MNELLKLQSKPAFALGLPERRHYFLVEIVPQVALGTPLWEMLQGRLALGFGEANGTEGMIAALSLAGPVADETQLTLRAQLSSLGARGTLNFENDPTAFNRTGLSGHAALCDHHRRRRAETAAGICAACFDRRPHPARRDRRCRRPGARPRGPRADESRAPRAKRASPARTAPSPSRSSPVVTNCP